MYVTVTNESKNMLLKLSGRRPFLERYINFTYLKFDDLQILEFVSSQKVGLVCASKEHLEFFLTNNLFLKSSQTFQI